MITAHDLHQTCVNETQKGNFLTALQLSEEAMLKYQEEQNDEGFSEIQAMRFIIFKHLHEKTQDKKFIILARNAATIAVELAQESTKTSSLAQPYLNLGKAFELEQKYQEASEYYQKALNIFTTNPPERFNKDAIRADVKAHIAFALYMSGEKELGLQKMTEAIQEQTQAQDVPEFEHHVWLSGAHMRTAEMLCNDDTNSAHKHLEDAKKIIDSDDRLTLRKAQWEKLAEKIA